MKKRVLSLNGGGAKIYIILVALMMLEKATGKKTYQLFDLIIGTSTGSIVAAILGMGTFTAEETINVVKSELPKVFKRKFSRKHKYSKDALRKAFQVMFPAALLGDVKTKVIITSLEDTTKVMHFFKSWEPKDRAMPLFNPVDRSSAAPLFFGPVIDYDEAKVWLDGGVGIFNNPSLYAYEEVRRLGWIEKEVQCINLGTGYKDYTRTFEDASNDKKLAQIMNFLAPKEGGLARETASSEICRFLKCRTWSFARIDRIIPAKLDIMDGVKFFEEYCHIGRDEGQELIMVYNSVSD